MMRKLALAGMAAWAAMPHFAMARPELRMETQMFVERVHTDINGRARRTLASTSRAAPGDQIVFVVNWRNEGREPVQGIALTNPVPRGTLLTTADPSMQVSVDGGQRWGRLEDLWLPTPLGGTRRAVPADITHVRWNIPTRLSPGETARLSYRATMR
jgi:uncharacterized repeat protein (TIGR01451 family)